MIQRIEPGPGQESVWDYPRPPAVELSSRRIRIEFAGETIIDTTGAVRVLETSHPPVYYLPLSDLMPGSLTPTSHATFCEFKGMASYWDVIVADRRASNAAWGYENPSPGFEALLDRVAIYPSLMDRAMVDDEVVDAQAGDFYGGWITSDIVGPFKGGAGTWGW